MMTLPGTALAAHEFFRGMPARHVDRLAAAAHYADLPAGHRFFEEGGRADRFWLIQAGAASASTCASPAAAPSSSRRSAAVPYSDGPGCSGRTNSGSGRSPPNPSAPSCSTPAPSGPCASPTRPSATN